MQHSLFSVQTSYETSASVTPSTLYVREPGGAFVPADTTRVLDAARNIAHQVLPERINMSDPERVKAFFAMKLNSNLEHEVFAMAMLDAQFRLLEYVEPFRGTLTQASVYPREVVKMGLAANAAAIIIGHNHPSGCLDPSQADLALTRHLKQALAMVDIRLLDHILVADNKTLSFAERGQL
ncbi:JAB domain-containing protein [Neopusillimonas maritima]|uniref:DNA repair protein RadC n=1 Tax=Neopusillimonas maritima TaxID=2026239 RepID=A0A3A1YQL6_9BURK|nr:JAB domain-containing protein [Neopusillimonas maritima]RIY39776.1 DNA repair protein RadC [Neopusillimonas maritima]